MTDIDIYAKPEIYIQYIYDNSNCKLKDQKMKNFNFIFTVCTICSFSITSHSTNMDKERDLPPYIRTSHGFFFNNMEQLLDTPGGQYPNYPSYTANVNVQPLAPKAPYEYLEGRKLDEERFVLKSKIMAAKILGSSMILADIVQSLSEYKSICYYYAKTNVLEDSFREVLKRYFVNGTNNIFTILQGMLQENLTGTTGLGEDYSKTLIFINKLKKSGMTTHRQDALLPIFEHAARYGSYIEKRICLVYTGQIINLSTNCSIMARAASCDLIYREFEWAIKKS